MSLAPAGPRAAWPGAVTVLGLAGGYLGLALLSILLSRASGLPAGIWYANALATVVLARAPWRQWPLLLALALSANAAANLLCGDPWHQVLAFLAPNGLEIVLAAAGVRRAGLADSPLRSLPALLRLLLLGAVLPQAASALLAAALFQALDLGPALAVAQIWFEGGAVGAIAALPALLVLAGQPRAGWRALAGDLRLWLLLCVALAVTLLCLAHVPFPFVYLGLPLLVAAMLLDMPAVALGVLATSVTASAALAGGVLVPPPFTSAWQHGFLYLAHAAAVTPALLLAAAVGSLRDHHARLLERQRALGEANQALQQFAHMAAHDLREPLNTIAQFTGLVLQDHAPRLPEDAAQYLRLVRRETERMRLLLDDVLQYSQVQRGELPPPRPVALDGALDQACQALAARLRDSGAVLRRAPLPVVRGHAPLLALLLQNLLDNALKFVAPGAVPEVEVGARLGEAGGTPSVWLTVADHGVGIAADGQARLFRPFQRLHPRRDYPGTGLGLALCRQIARVHEGEIAVDSAPGEGARFTVRLPLWTGA